MKLWDMLDKSVYYAETWIFVTNCYDQNMPIFKGCVDEARRDADDVWDYLMCDVEIFDTTNGVLLIKVRDSNYESRLESHYLFSERWKTDKAHRPWRYSSEIDQELREEQDNK